MKRSWWLLAAALVFPPAVTAQRTDGRSGMPPVHQDSTRPSRDGLFVRRAVQASYTALIAAVPFSIYALRQDGWPSDDVLIAGGLTYIGAATLGAARRRSSTCSFGERLLRATGGAIAGASTGMLWHIATDGDAYAAHHATDDRRRITAAGFAFGVPLGAAAALYNCR